MSDNNTLKNNAVTGFLWRFLERCGAQGVSFVVSILLARLLAPEAYGTISLVAVFTSLMQVFVDSGMGNALIQKKDADDLDFSSVFYFNMLVCSLLYVGMYFASPLIAGFYEDPHLTPVIRVLSLTLVISGVRNVQQAYVSKNMLFKKFFLSTIGGTVGAAAVGVAMAYAGFGVWALVAQQLINALVGTVVLWITVKWRPRRIFSLQRLKGLFSFGWKLLVSALLETGYVNLTQLIIGKVYSADDLAYYNRGNYYPSVIVTNINSSIDSVLLPTLAKEQEDRARVKAMTRRAIKLSVYIMAPMMVGLAVCAEPMVRLLLTDKWLGIVPFLRVFCVMYMFYPIHTANLNAINAMGRSDWFLKLEIVKKAIGLTLILITMWISVEAMAYSMLISTFTSTLINTYPNKRLMDYRWSEQMRDILPDILRAAVMGAAVYCLQYLPLPDIFTLLIQVLAGVGIYVGISVAFKVESFTYLVGILKNLLAKVRK